MTPDAPQHMKVLILYGGRSGEHEVSCLSAASVLRHLNPRRYTPLLCGITREGHWFLQEDSRVQAVLHGADLQVHPGAEVSIVPAKGFQAGGALLDLDMVFPVLHGTFGEDGTVQGLFEMTGVPYVGSGVLGSSLGMDKEKAKQVWQYEGIPVVPFRSFVPEDHREARGDIPEKTLRRLWQEWTAALQVPLFVKPARAGSSVGITKVHSFQELAPAMKTALSFDSKVLIEKAVTSKEIECSVVGNLAPRAFIPGEVEPHHEFYDYEAKYIDPDGAALIIPARIPEKDQHRIMELAVRAYRACEARGLARVDFFFHEDRGELYLNEINTMPGFTHISMFSKMCEAGGLEYSAVLDELIALGLQEFTRRNTLQYTRA